MYKNLLINMVFIFIALMMGILIKENEIIHMSNNELRLID